MTDAEPSVSTECSFLTTALRRAIRCTPIASTTDRMAGSPSGTAATARETPSSSTVTNSLERGDLVDQMAVTTMTTTAMTMTVTPRSLLTPAISFCSGDGLLVGGVEHLGDRAHLGAHAGAR